MQVIAMYYLGSVIHIEKTIDLFDTGNYHKKSNLKYKERASFFHFRGLIMLRCRSPPFLSKNADKKRNGGNKMPKEYYLYGNGQRVKVSEQIYKVYWREKEHEKYLEQVGKKNHSDTL